MLNGGNIRRNSRWIWNCLLDLVYPRTCVRCGRLCDGCDEIYTCRECRRGYEWIEGPVCDLCGGPFHGSIENRAICATCREKRPAFRQARSLFLYRRTGARLIHSLKYEKGTWLQEEITFILKESDKWRDYFSEGVLIPVPLHYRRLRSRGYNQAETVAAAIKGAFPTARIEPCLGRHRPTPSQTLLSREERFRNMRGAFFSSGSIPEGRLILVDDVLTSGATLDAAARALVEAGASGISAFTLAHG